MSDLYSELLVKKEADSERSGCEIRSDSADGDHGPGRPCAECTLLVPAIALGIACYFVIPKTDLEYEYLFVNGELDIDMIMSKSKRKK